jgi:hypothetical protein
MLPAMNKNFRFALLLVVSLFAVSANGAPWAYSVNSDSDDTDTEDGLYLIDLATGDHERKGTLMSGEKKGDTEGLAIAPDGTLWGIDDQTLTLFPINKSNGSINFQDEIQLSGFPTGGGNDFGMTFSCDNTLYVTSLNASNTVTIPTLYRLSMDGSRQIVGSAGALGVNISAIAAIGSPTRLYGLGNGQDGNGITDVPNLYSIDTTTGVATFIGSLGGQAGDYGQAGLAFDNEGNLWAITDRRIIDDELANLPSQILQIDVNNGTASFVSDTSEVGFESLAISAPTGCGSDYSPIPALNPTGRLLAIFMILFTGLVLLRKRIIQ